MCLALYASVGKEISNEQFKRFSLSNGDGFGMLYVENGILCNYKTMDVSDFYSKYKEKFDAIKDTPFVLHFRLATGGKHNIENCHPFMCSETVGFVHNGVISDMPKEQDYSDTYIFNRDYLVPISNELYGDFTKMLIKDSIGSFNKLIFLNNKKEFFIINEDQGKWKDGVWYSCAWHAEPEYTYTSHQSNRYTQSYKDNINKVLKARGKNSKKGEITENKFCEICGDTANHLLFEIKDDYKIEKCICIFCLRQLKNVSVGELIELLTCGKKGFGRSI